MEKTLLPELSSNQKGALAEMAVATHATRLGIEVYRPICRNARFDSIFLTDDRALRVQCKWAVRRGSVLTIELRSSRRGPDGFIRRCYGSGEVDLVIAYWAEGDACYALPIELVADRLSLSLRLEPARNGQSTGVNWARDYELERIPSCRT